MNIKKITTIFIFLVFIVSGCNTVELKVTEEQAKTSVIKQHTKHIGKVKILSVDLKRNNYLVEWENEGNCEKGIDSVDGESGAIEMIEASIC